MGVVVGDQQAKLEKALAPFEKETGIDVVYEGTDAFATLLPARVDGGQAPDIAMFPQPGLMKDFAEDDQLVPVSQFMDPAKLKESYLPYWLGLSTLEGENYGVWYRASVKSLVWYNPQEFKKAGYEVPKTWDEMVALSDQIVKDGKTPWCLGMESGDSTGWVGTDWIEDIMLRTAGPEGYDRWTTNEMPFDAPEVKTAFETFGQIALKPQFVAGGKTAILSTPFGDSPNGLFASPPQCYLHRQANYITSFFPPNAKLGQNADVFLLPAIKPDIGAPVLVAGDVFGMFNDTPEARQLMQYLSTPKPHEIWVKLGGFISPLNQVGPDAYPDPVSKKEAEILKNAEAIRFDASDQMPGAVGTGAFWSGVTEYIGGSDLDTVLSDIQSTWP
jgi:alpha-glucoside transport system substrate-binding protein